VTDEQFKALTDRLDKIIELLQEQSDYWNGPVVLGGTLSPEDIENFKVNEGLEEARRISQLPLVERVEIMKQRGIIR
jgi:hypothetical protein